MEATRLIPVSLPNNTTIFVEATVVSPEQDVAFTGGEFGDIAGPLEGIAAAVSSAIAKVKPKKASVELGLEVGLEFRQDYRLASKGNGEGKSQGHLELGKLAPGSTVDIYQRLHLCTVRIETSGPRRQGTGFFVSPELILTCGHVVAVEDGQACKEISIQFSTGSYSAQLNALCPPPFPDLALLSVDVPEHACVLLDRAVAPSDQLYSFGFPADPEGVRAEAVTVEVEGERVLGDGNGERQFLKFKGGQILPGASGAPLLNQRTHRVCGVMKRTRDERSDLGGLGIPASVVLACFPDLEKQQREYHALNRSWFNDVSTSLREKKSKAAIRSERSAREKISRLAEDIAEATKWVIEEFEKLPGEEIRELVVDEARRAASEGLRDGRQTDQAGALEEIIKAISSRSPPTIALGGVSGVGKSAVMRRAALHAANAFLNREKTAENRSGPPAIVPIAINLNCVTSRKGRRASLGTTIIQWWIQYANKMIAAHYRVKGRTVPPKKMVSKDLEELSRVFDLVGILDSVDEFLERNPQFEESDVVDWIGQVPNRERRGTAPFYQVFIGRRTSDETTGLLARACSRDIHLARLSETAAKHMLPSGLWDKLTSASDEDARDLLRTPFISTLFRDYGDKRLRVLAAEPRLERIFDVHRNRGGGAPAGALIEFALRCYLWRDEFRHWLKSL